MQKPAPLPPGQVTALLHPNVPDALRTISLLGAWVTDGVRWLVGAVDRQNATGIQDDLKASPLLCLAWSVLLPMPSEQLLQRIQQK